MKKIQYLDILKKAFFLTWENKFLWIFGFLVLLGSVSSNFDVYGKQSEQNSNAAAFIQQHPGLFVAMGIFIIVIAIVFFLLKIMATVAIIKSANNIALYRQLSIKAILVETKKYLWRMLLLEIIISISLLAVVMVVAVPVIYLFFLEANFFAYLSLALAILIVFPLVILAYFLQRFAWLYVAIGNFEIKMALESAYGVFTENVKPSLIMGLITILLSLLLLIVLPILSLLIALVVLIPGFIAYLLFAKIGATIFVVIGVLSIAIFSLCLFSWYAAFMQVVWLNFFQQIAFEKHKEKKIVENLETEGSVSSPEAV